MTSQHARTSGTRASARPRRRGPAAAVAAVTAGALVLGVSACTTDDTQVSTPSRVLQTVEASLGSDGSLASVASTSVSVDDVSGASSSATAELAPADVADELPVRTSVRWRTADGAGTDLADLAGHTGRVEIDLTVENLTVAPRQLDYDAAGVRRSEPALVGAPLSVAASTVLPGTSVARVLTSTDGADDATNGIVGTTASGDTVVQWGALLAPPRTGASTTLRLVADVDDFTVPTVDVAVQPGLSTDLSIDGVLGSAFDTGPTSELALQQRTIDLVGDVTLVLARAGQTITEVRTNLESTSETLGVRTAEQLEESSSSLSSTMQGLTGQLTALEGDLGSTVTGTQSVVRGQLQETVASVGSLLGDTSASAPTVAVDGEGCAAVVPEPDRAASVYGSLLQMSAQLDAYAATSAGCRDQVAADLASTVGPADPTVQTCYTDVDGQLALVPSLTCALFDSSVTVTAALVDLVEQGAEIAASLQPEIVRAALDRHAELATDLDSLSAQLTALQEDSDDDVTTALAELRSAATRVSSGIDALALQVSQVNRDARAARAQIDGSPFRTSMKDQTAALARELCALVDDDLLGREGLPATEVERLRSYLTDESCPVVDEGTGETTTRPLGAPFPFPGSLDDRLDEQAEAWDAVVASTDVTDTTQGLGADLATLDSDADAVVAALDDAERALAAEDGSLGTSLDALEVTTDEALRHSGLLGDRLDALAAQQDGLGDQVTGAFAEAARETSDEVRETVAGQTRVVSAQGATSQQSVVEAFDRSIAGLRSTSEGVVDDARETVDEQRGRLDGNTGALTSAIDAQTAATLERIGATTASSTRDVEGARALLIEDLAAVMLDLGDREVEGSGILGAMATSAAQADTADFQLALASRNAAGYANIRGEDVAGIMLRQAQFGASLDAADSLPAFHLDVPAGATSTTLYSFRIGADR